MIFECPTDECSSRTYRLEGSRFSTTVSVICTDCNVLIAKADQMDFTHE